MSHLSISVPGLMIKNSKARVSCSVLEMKRILYPIKTILQIVLAQMLPIVYMYTRMNQNQKRIKEAFRSSTDFQSTVQFVI